MIKPLVAISLILSLIPFAAAQNVEQELEFIEIIDRDEKGLNIEEAMIDQQGELLNSMPQLSANSSLLNSSLSFLFSFLRYDNRSLPYTTKSYTLNGIELNSLSTSRIPYSALGSLYRLPGYSTSNYSLKFSVQDANFALNSTQNQVIEPSLSYNNGYLYSSISSKTYSFRHAAGYNLKARNGWEISIDATRNWGESLSVEGVWSDNLGFTLSASKRLGNSSSSSSSGAGVLNMTLLLNSTQRAYSKSITDEAAELSGNQLYNPAWGVQNGEPRSVNVRGGFEPTLLLNYSQELDNNLKLSLMAAGRVGKSYYSALSWQSASNPTPDYYRNMPSYQDSEAAKELTTWMWQNDVNSRQINFEALYLANQSASDGRAYYIIENRVNEPMFFSLGGRLQGGDFSVGFAAAYQYERYYKELSSLLGASYWLDVDSFVEQDDDVKELTQNNLQDPNRRIYEGDEFGYNYSMSNLKLSLDGAYAKEWGNFKLSGGARLDMLTFQREGYYEKENFPSGNSLGASESVVGFDYSLRLQGEYRAGGGVEAHLTAGYNSLSARVDELFLVPEYRNSLTPEVCNSTVVSFEGGLSYKSSGVRMGVNLYSYIEENAMAVKGIYDDMNNCYMDYVVSGISTNRSGLEAWGEILVWGDLWFSFVGIWQSSLYSGDATGVGYKNSSGVEVVESERLYYEGLHLGGSPEKLGALILSYKPWGWNVSGSLIFFEGVYDRLSPIRYSQRALDRASDEIGGAAGMMEQGQGSWGVSLDLSGGYNFRFENGCSFGVYAGVSNLLDNREISTGRYQSDRFCEDGWYLTPQESKGYYALGVNGYLSLVFRF